MGMALARAAYIRGAKVTLIAGNITEDIPEYLECIKTSTADEMFKATMKEFPKNQVTIMTAAVSDYTPAKPSKMKIKKADEMILELKRTKDILLELGKKKTDKQTLVGFAAESEKIIENAKLKLKKKNLDFIAANNLKVAGKDETEIIFIGKKIEEKLTGSKFQVAHQILDFIFSK
jgi:phosphopantothenoylcysteine decarboxylase/phosphopantothenate--cysteine ligase